jgi:hypothetical protein
LDSFVVKQHKISSTTDLIDEAFVQTRRDSSSSRQILERKEGPITARVAERQRREIKKSDRSQNQTCFVKRKKYFQAATGGAYVTKAESRASIIQEVIAKLINQDIEICSI